MDVSDTSITESAGKESTEPTPKPQSPLGLAPLPERDLELVDLPTEFDPDAEPIIVASSSSAATGDVEDTLQVPIQSIEDEDAEEARQLAELDKRRNPPQDEGDEDDGDLEELLRGLQGDEDGEGEIEGNEDEIIAEMPQEEEEPDIVLGEEVVPEVEVASLPEAPMQQEQEEVQMDSSMSPLSCLTKECADFNSILISFVRFTRPPNRST